MKNKDQWEPTKFVIRKGKIRSSKNKRHLHIGSRLCADIIGMHYSEIISEHFNGRLIDLGCGYVPLYQAYKDFIEDNVCVDWSSSLHQCKYADFEQDLNQSLNIQENSFDTALMSDVLEHIREPQMLISEVHRILKPGGKLIMNIPFYYWVHEAPYDYFRFTRYSLYSMLKNADFNIVLLQPFGGALEVLTDVFSKVVCYFPLLGGLIAKLCQWKCFMFIKTRIGKKISNNTCEQFPLGYIVVAQKK